MRIRKIKSLIFSLLLVMIVACSQAQNLPRKTAFDGERALKDIQYQLNLGPRVPGSQAHQKFREWLVSELELNGWAVNIQKGTILGNQIVNIVATSSQSDEQPRVIIGAHYDSRKFADRDTVIENRDDPVPGANDGASGVSVLLELARILPKKTKSNIWLVFFDAEDQGNIPPWEWIMGSSYFVDQLDNQPDAVVVVDMVGDADLKIFLEKNSDQILARQIWAIAEQMGYGEKFIAQPKHRMVDDHLPFVQAGIPAVLIIDYEYPYWHTTDDKIDKVSAESLKAVGDVLISWLQSLNN